MNPTSPSAALCQPSPELSCFACCPPMRPAGYDHCDHRGPLSRIFSDNRSAYLAGELPQKPMVGFSCPGLGFLDRRGKQVGCLLHPARNQGRDLREPTGYAEKCARETCPELRAFAGLTQAARELLLDRCQGMDSFSFSSRRRNPVMKLLGLGPVAAEAAADIEDWPWLEEMDPAWGWMLGRLIETQGPQILHLTGLAARVEKTVGELGRRLGPKPPLAGGEPLHTLCSQWEARFWRQLSGTHRSNAAELERRRLLLNQMLSEPNPG